MSNVDQIASGQFQPRLTPVGAPASGARLNGTTTSAPQRNGDADSVNLSSEARLLDALRENDVIRTDLIERVRAEIEAGTYETEERLSAAADAIADELFG